MQFGRLKTLIKMRGIKLFFSIISVCWLLSLLFSWMIIWWVQMIFIQIPFRFVLSKEQREDACSIVAETMQMIYVDYLHPLWRNHVLRPFPKKEVQGRPYIVMVNHLSNADPWMAIRPQWPLGCKWVYKGSLDAVPFGAGVMKNAGYLAVEFTKDKDGWGTKKGSVAVLMSRSAELLRRNCAITVFPEGIRNKNPSGPLGEFKIGFFTLAIQEGATIVPMGISGTEKAWPRDDWRLGFADIYISCGDPISPEGHTAESLRDTTRAAITELLRGHPDRGGDEKVI